MHASHISNARLLIDIGVEENNKSLIKFNKPSTGLLVVTDIAKACLCGFDTVLKN